MSKFDEQFIVAQHQMLIATTASDGSSKLKSAIDAVAPIIEALQYGHPIDGDGREIVMDWSFWLQGQQESHGIDLSSWNEPLVAPKIRTSKPHKNPSLGTAAGRARPDSMRSEKLPLAGLDSPRQRIGATLEHTKRKKPKDFFDMESEVLLRDLKALKVSYRFADASRNVSLNAEREFMSSRVLEFRKRWASKPVKGKSLRMEEISKAMRACARRNPVRGGRGGAVSGGLPSLGK